MSGIASAMFALAMIAAFALLVGGVKLIRAHETRKRGVLMVIAALVLIGNVAIWTV